MPRLSSAQVLRPLLLCFVLAGCGRGIGPEILVASTDVTFNEEFDLAPAQTANLAGTDLAVRLDSVSGDSRCPQGAACVWAGDANVNLSLLRGKRMPTPVVLHVTLMPRRVDDGTETIELVGLEPFARMQDPIKPSDYRVRLVIRKKS